jgi:hypothetical protein
VRKQFAKKRLGARPAVFDFTQSAGEGARLAAADSIDPGNVHVNP